MTAAVTVQRYRAEAHEREVLGIVAAMAGEPYPGQAAGTSLSEHAAWLRRVPIVHRWVAVADSGPVAGHVSLSPARENGALAGVGEAALEVTRLFVHPGWRRRGVATMLMHRAQHKALAHCAGSVLVVSDYLGDAASFYESLGWVRVGSKQSVLSGDHLHVYRLDAGSVM